MSAVNAHSTEDEVLAYLKDRCGSLIKTYGQDTFSGVDGEAFLGLTPGTIEMVFPALSTKDKGILLARIETMRNLNGFVSDQGGLRSPVTGMLMGGDRDVTPPPQFFRPSPPASPKPPPPVLSYTVDVPIDEDRFKTQYRRSHSPRHASEKRPNPGSLGLPPSAPLGSGAEIPRIFMELWRTTDEAKEEFLAETWLPDLREVELRTDLFRLALKRPMRTRDKRVVAGRKWFATLIVAGRFHRIDNRLELVLHDVRGVDILSQDFNFYFVKIFLFSTHHQTVTPFYESRRLPVGLSNSVDFDEQVTVRFGQAEEGKTLPSVSAVGPTDVTSILKVVSSNGNSAGSSARGRSADARGAGAGAVIRARSTSAAAATPKGFFSVDILKALMMRDPENMATKSVLTEQHTSLLSLYDLLLFANHRELFNMSPRFNRFEAHLLPTHEVNSFSGAEFTLRSMAQIDSLKGDAEYMRNHSQVVELLMLSWGFGEQEETASYLGAWSGHSWLLRHALLSCLLLGNVEAAKRLVGVTKKLSQGRQIDMAEAGFGEVLFTLGGNRTEAQIFWDTAGYSGGIRSPYLPAVRSSLGQLIHFQGREW